MNKLLLLLLLMPFSVFAVYEGKVDSLEFGPIYGDIIYINVVGVQPNRPACATNTTGYDFAFDGSTATGDKLFATLLAAQASDTMIRISGTGTCLVGSGVEDLRWIQSH